MRILKRLLAISIALVMGVSLFTSCGKTDPGTGSDASAASGTQSNADTLVVATSHFENRFSPFFAQCVADQTNVVDLTQLTLLTGDRNGNIVTKGIDGETRPFNGTDYTYYGPANLVITENSDGSVYYDFTLRDDLVFSDGTPITIDDVIFSMYVICDPTFDGPQTLYSQPILGLENYRSGVSPLSSLLGAAGEDNTDFSLWTEEQQTAFWAAMRDGGVKFAECIVDYCASNGLISEGTGQVAGTAAVLGIEGLGADATAEDLFLTIGEACNWIFSDMEVDGIGSLLSDFIPADVYALSAQGIETGDSAENIEGIQRTGDYSMRVVTTEVSADMIYQLSVPITPLHYYGDKSLYDYNGNSFGFPKGDLSSIRAKTSTPLGAGMFTFKEYSNGTVYLEANPSHYLGTPKIKQINFLESSENDKVTGIKTGTVDLADPSYSTTVCDQIADYNGGSDDLDGKIITTRLFDYLGYGYIGMNAERVKVGGEPASEASLALRKALATVISVYRDESIDSYYGDSAAVINYPISSISWASPQITDDGYRTAYSTDISGNSIYSSGMGTDDKYAAALQAALDYFEAAGYTISDGKLTAAPAGARMDYTCNISANGKGDHPSFLLLSNAAAALKTIGFDLMINDLTTDDELFATIDADSADLWVAGWGSAPDPDMYQVYHTDGNTNYYNLSNSELDELIMAARQSTDQSYRKGLYKSAMEIIMDQGVVIPVYQRKECFLFSTERVDTTTLSPDLTSYWPWQSEAHKLEMR